MSNPPFATEMLQMTETSAAASVVAEPAIQASAEKLDEVENIDFLLEEIENKIAPLALA